MKSWDLTSLTLRPHAPEILSTSADARAIALELPAGESLQEHEVRERAWVTVVAGQVQITTATGEAIQGGPGLTLEFEPAERHAVQAVTDARLLLLLLPWPAEGHLGTLSPEQRATVRQRASDSHPS